MSTADGEFTIRVAGAAPPPLPSPATKKGKKEEGRQGRKQRGKPSKNSNAGARKQQQYRYNLRLRPSSSLEQMRKHVFALFNIPSGSTMAYRVSFLGGFPPKELYQQGKNTVHELGIRPNESLIVKFTLTDTAKQEGDSSNETLKDSAATKSTAAEEPAAESERSSTASNTIGRQKRSSAIAATANFREVIAAQDAILKNEKKASTKRGISSKSGGGNIVGLGNSSKRSAQNNYTSSAASGKKSKKVKMEGAGYRLSDGKSFAGLPSPSKKRQQHQIGFGSKDEIADTLISSLGRVNGGETASRFLRAAMKVAVDKSYEASRAAVRVTSVNQGEFEFEKLKGGSVVAGGGVVLGTAKDLESASNRDETPDVDDELGRTLFTVSYSKGIEGRGRYEEQVEIISLVAVKAVLEHVYDTASSNSFDGVDSERNDGSKDGRLRPVLIAELSPRIFWSLVYHCSEAEKKHQNHTPSSVEDMLRFTLPNLDWAHLERGGRKRVLSEKARENLRQEKEVMAQSLPNDSSHDQEEALKTIEEIEESIMNEANDGNEQELSERELRAKAAMARFESLNGTTALSASSTASQKDDALDDWVLMTPTEDDIDELIECIMDGALSEGNDHTSDNYDKLAAKAWAGVLLDNVRNWRVLANCEVEQILSILTDKNSRVPSSDTIGKWIDSAQDRALEEIMLEILDGDSDALEALVDKACSGCPRDLINWQWTPEMLLNTMSDNAESSKKWEKSDVMRWISRSKTALGVCTWLELYTTPVTAHDATG